MDSKATVKSDNIAEGILNGTLLIAEEYLRCKCIGVDHLGTEMVNTFWARSFKEAEEK